MASFQKYIYAHSHMQLLQHYGMEIHDFLLFFL
jgi:hypothetical protein